MLLPAQLLTFKTSLRDAEVDPNALGEVKVGSVPLLSGVKLPPGTVYCEARTGYFFFIGRKDGHFALCYAPGESAVRVALNVPSWDDVLPHIQKWAGWLKRELDVELMWDAHSKPESIRSVLLLSQADAIFWTLVPEKAYTPGFVWEAGGNAATLRWRHVPRADYWFRFERAERDWNTQFAPAQSDVSEVRKARGWEAVLQDVRDWASYLARQFDAMARLEKMEQATTGSLRSLPASWRIGRLQLEGIRRFADLDLSFSTPDGCRRMTLLIGKNGTGKTTLLRCLALALCRRQDAEALLTAPVGRLVSSDRKEARIAVTLQDLHGETRELETRLRVNNGREDIEAAGEPPELLVCGYGSGRAVEGRDLGKGEVRQAHSVASLFHYETYLMSAELVLRRMAEDEQKRTLEAMSRVLQNDARLRLVENGLEVVEPGGLTTSFAGWADGYRLSATWMLDLIGWARLTGQLDENGVSGILLFDEFEQHLHPFMQANLLSSLQKAFPGVQVIGTTHSPMVALGAQPEELVVLSPRPDGKVEVKSAPDYRSYSVEDMYTHDYLFGTEPYSPELQRKLARYHELALIDRSQRSTEESAELVNLAREVEPAG